MNFSPYSYTSIDHYSISFTSIFSGQIDHHLKFSNTSSAFPRDAVCAESSLYKALSIWTKYLNYLRSVPELHFAQPFAFELERTLFVISE